MAQPQHVRVASRPSAEVESPVARPLYALLAQARVGDVPLAAAEHAARSGWTLPELLRAMAQRRVQAMPVVNAQGSVIACVDYHDVLKTVLVCLPDVKQLAAAPLAAWQAAVALLYAKTVADVIEATPAWKSAPLVAVERDNPLSTLVRAFAGGLKCAVVTTDAGLFLGSLDPLDVVAFVHRRATEEPWAAELSAVSLHTLVQPRTKTLAVSRDASAHRLLQLLYLEGASAVALLDDAGKLVGNFSISDVLHVVLDAQRVALLDSAEDVLLKQSPSSMEVLVLRPASSLLEAVASFAASHRHHLWLADAESCAPVGEVCLADLAKLLLQH